MDRRGFLKMLVGGVATAAAVRTFPFRVFSFPTEIVSPDVYDMIGRPEFVALELEKVIRFLPQLIAQDRCLYDNFSRTHMTNVESRLLR